MKAVVLNTCYVRPVFGLMLSCFMQVRVSAKTSDIESSAFVIINYKDGVKK